MKNESVFIAFGGNLPGPAGSPAKTIDAARVLLARKGVHVVAQSPLYASDPWGGVRQPIFLNGVWEARFFGLAPDLLEMLLGVEKILGRRRRTRWGPRVIDLDLLAFGAVSGAWEVPHPLELPHPRLGDRAFVLLPLADLAAQLVLPGEARTIGQMAANLPLSARIGCRRLRR